MPTVRTGPVDRADRPGRPAGGPRRDGRARRRRLAGRRRVRRRHLRRCSRRGLHRPGAAALGPADRVTLTRATLVGGVAALTADSFDRPAPVAVLVALAVVALVLDAVDGQVARRTGTASALGARFDMEVDAFLILVLSVYVAPLGGRVGARDRRDALRVRRRRAGLLPWLRGRCRRGTGARWSRRRRASCSWSRRPTCCPRPLVVAALAVALALLVESFGRDVAWLWPPVPPPAASALETAAAAAQHQTAATGRQPQAHSPPSGNPLPAARGCPGPYRGRRRA